MDPFLDTGRPSANKAVASVLKTSSWDRGGRYNRNDSESYATSPEETYASETYARTETYASETYASVPPTYASVVPSEASAGIYASIPDVHADAASADNPARAMDGNRPVEEAAEDRELAGAVDEGLISDMRSEFANELDNISTDGISLDGILVAAMNDHMNNEHSLFAAEVAADYDDESLYADCNAVADIPSLPCDDDGDHKGDPVYDVQTVDLAEEGKTLDATSWPAENTDDDDDDDIVDRQSLFGRRSSAA